MKYFEKDFLQFFKDLAGNNNRDWFLENKKRYDKSVKKPFETFTSALITEIRKHDKTVNIKTSDAIFRINRDIRFSNDKTPYKLNTSAAIADGGRKSQGATGIYIELGPEKMGLAGGIHMPDKDLLNDIRSHLALKPDALQKVLDDKNFKQHWGELQGEKNKILPPAFKEVALKCPHIYNKQFFYWVELKPSMITSEKLIETVLEYYHAAQPVSKFLQGIIRKK